MTFLNRLFKKFFGPKYFKVKGIIYPNIYHYYKIKGRKLYNWAPFEKKWILVDYDYRSLRIFDRQYKEITEKEAFLELL